MSVVTVVFATWLCSILFGAVWSYRLFCREGGPGLDSDAMRLADCALLGPVGIPLVLYIIWRARTRARQRERDDVLDALRRLGGSSL